MNDTYGHKNEEIERWIFENTDKKVMMVEDYEVFHCFFQLAMLSIAMEIKDYFDEVPVDTIKSRFAKKLEILKNGICRNGSEGRAGNS